MKTKLILSLIAAATLFSSCAIRVSRNDYFGYRKSRPIAVQQEALPTPNQPADLDDNPVYVEPAPPASVYVPVITPWYDDGVFLSRPFGFSRWDNRFFDVRFSFGWNRFGYGNWNRFDDDYCDTYSSHWWNTGWTFRSYPYPYRYDPFRSYRQPWERYSYPWNTTIINNNYTTVPSLPPSPPINVPQRQMPLRDFGVQRPVQNPLPSTFQSSNVAQPSVSPRNPNTSGGALSRTPGDGSTPVKVQQPVLGTVLTTPQPSPSVPVTPGYQRGNSGVGSEPVSTPVKSGVLITVPRNDNERSGNPKIQQPEREQGQGQDWRGGRSRGASREQEQNSFYREQQQQQQEIIRRQEEQQRRDIILRQEELARQQQEQQRRDTERRREEWNSRQERMRHEEQVRKNESWHRAAIERSHDQPRRNESNNFGNRNTQPVKENPGLRNNDAPARSAAPQQQSSSTPSGGRIR